jgi:hypothetical protein
MVRCFLVRNFLIYRFCDTNIVFIEEPFKCAHFVDFRSHFFLSARKVLNRSLWFLDGLFLVRNILIIDFVVFRWF